MSAGVKYSLCILADNCVPLGRRYAFICSDADGLNHMTSILAAWVQLQSPSTTPVSHVDDAVLQSCSRRRRLWSCDHRRMPACRRQNNGGSADADYTHFVKLLGVGSEAIWVQRLALWNATVDSDHLRNVRSQLK